MIEKWYNRLNGPGGKQLKLINSVKSCSGHLGSNIIISQFDWLIIGQDSAFLLRWIQLLNKTENAHQPKLSLSSLKTSESYKTQEKAFDKTLE